MELQSFQLNEDWLTIENELCVRSVRLGIFVMLYAKSMRVKYNASVLVTGENTWRKDKEKTQGENSLIIQILKIKSLNY